MARKYQNHTLQTDTLHRGEETQSTNSRMTFKVIFKQPSLSSPNKMISNLERTLSTA